MKKNLVIGSALVSLLVLSYVGIAQLNSTKKEFKQTQESEEESMEKESRDFVTTPSGLKYIVLKEGEGEPAKKGQMVKARYTGWLDDNGTLGKQFDSNASAAQPFAFAAGNGMVIKGWDEAFVGSESHEGMRVGEKRHLIIPPQLGYGARAVGPIPANSTLHFDVELVEIVK
jgi:FKBP-type peptidyl-prolyl cis-trans isomerase